MQTNTSIFTGLKIGILKEGLGRQGIEKNLTTVTLYV